MMDFDTFTKLPKNVGDLGKLIVAKGFKKLHKVQKIAQSGHTDSGSRICLVSRVQIPLQRATCYREWNKLDE